ERGLARGRVRAHGDDAVTPTEAPPTYLVRHGAMRFLGEFAPAAGVTARRGDAVVVHSDRGTEMGEVLCPATPQAVAAIPEPTRGEVLRLTTPEDRAKLGQLRDLHEVDYEAGTRLIKHHKLAMQLVDVERLFGGERIIFYF